VSAATGALRAASCCRAAEKGEELASFRLISVTVEVFGLSYRVGIHGGDFARAHPRLYFRRLGR
jgi:hypothetical protein